LTSGDFATLTERTVGLVPQSRVVMFLEGGYDLDALSRSAGACVAAMAGADHDSEPQTSGGPGRDVVEQAGQPLRGDAKS
jgi:acetoin utilization deacetylase AcuC-like enzyme